ncbi:IS66 family transposase [Butyrivibrio sp. LC3010]|uniref:IS66 family transposase n=1 Tax=Butyrivibrio sp. LC3010 TaxID=1280680 RepID=UPI001FA76F68|nr:transposase [Butyrivibrio sp. LC3010]
MNHAVGIVILVWVLATQIIVKIMYHSNVDLLRIPFLYAMVVTELTLPWGISDMSFTLKGLNPDIIKVKRLEKEKPNWDAFKEWLEKLDPAGGSALRKAVNYNLNNWDKLMRYLEDGKAAFVKCSR